MFQNYALFAHLTAKQNIAEGLITVKGWNKDDAYNSAHSKSSMISALATREINTPPPCQAASSNGSALAGPWRSKPSCCCLTSRHRRWIPEWVGEVLSLMQKLATRHQTMLVVTHEMQFAREVADRVIFMADGSFVEQGTPDQIFGNPQDPRLKKFLSQVGIR